MLKEFLIKEIMTSHNRVKRRIDGKSNNQIKLYEKNLIKYGRKNVK